VRYSRAQWHAVRDARAYMYDGMLCRAYVWDGLLWPQSTKKGWSPAEVHVHLIFPARNPLINTKYLHRSYTAYSHIQLASPIHLF